MANYILTIEKHGAMANVIKQNQRNTLTGGYKRIERQKQSTNLLPAATAKYVFAASNYVCPKPRIIVPYYTDGSWSQPFQKSLG